MWGWSASVVGGEKWGTDADGAVVRAELAARGPCGWEKIGEFGRIPECVVNGGWGVVLEGGGRAKPGGSTVVEAAPSVH